MKERKQMNMITKQIIGANMTRDVPFRRANGQDDKSFLGETVCIIDVYANGNILVEYFEPVVYELKSELEKAKTPRGYIQKVLSASWNDGHWRQATSKEVYESIQIGTNRTRHAIDLAEQEKPEVNVSRTRLHHEITSSIAKMKQTFHEYEGKKDWSKRKMASAF